MTFYNTSNESNPQLQEFRKVAENQDIVILKLLKKHGELRPRQMFVLLNYEYELTSIRRSCDTLHSDDKIKRVKQYVNEKNRKEWSWVAL